MSSASVQSTFGNHPALGLPGMEYDTSPANYVESRIASEEITYGKYVVISGETCRLPNSIAETQGMRGGVALRDPTNPAGKYVSGDPVAIMLRGCVWVPTEEAIAVTDPVFVRHGGATGATESDGLFRNDADGITSAANAANPPGCVWRKAGSTLALLELGAPVTLEGVTGPTG